MPLRIIQVGVGGMGACWTQAVHESQEWEAAAYVDINPDNLAKAARDHGMDPSSCFTDLDEALRKVEADALLDITPQKSREEVTTKALRAGLPVLSEKPLSYSMESAKRIVKVAEEEGLIFMVSQNYRFHRVPRTIRRLLEERRVGEVGYVDLEFYKGPQFPGSYRIKMAQPLLEDMSIHHFDLMRYMFDSDAKSIFAVTIRPEWSWFEGDPTLAMIIEMENGVLISYGGSWVAKGLETPWEGNWRIECSEGGIYWRDGKIYLSNREEPLGEEELLPMPFEGLAYSLHEFYCSIKEKRDPETGGKDNLKSLAMVFAAIDSARRGEKVLVEDYL